MKEDRRARIYEWFGTVPMPALLEKLMINLHRTLVCFDEWDKFHPHACRCEWCDPIKGSLFALEICWNVLEGSVTETPALAEETGSLDDLPAGVRERQKGRLLTCEEQKSCFRLFRAAAKRQHLCEGSPDSEATRRRLVDEAYGLIIRARNSPGLGHAPRRLNGGDCRCLVNGKTRP